MVRHLQAEIIIFSGMVFGKQATAGHFHSEGQSPLLPNVLVWQACAPSLLFPFYQKEQPIPGKAIMISDVKGHPLIPQHVIKY